MSSEDTEFISILGASEVPGDASPSKVASRSLPDVLPLLGLSDIVFFPGMVAPLLVESAASIRLIDDVVAGDRFLGLVLQRRAEVENPGPDDVWGFGCAGRVLKMLKFPDNTVRVLVEGLRRFEIVEAFLPDPYLKARIRTHKDQVRDSIELKALARTASTQFQSVIELSPAMSDQVKVAALNAEEPGKLSDLIAANLNLNIEERQHLLEIVDVKERLSRLLPLLGRELEVLTLGSKIQKEVATSMSKSQREFFLREQLRAIQRELGEADPQSNELDVLRETVEKNSLPEEPRKVALREIDRMRSIPPSVAEYTVSRNYVDWLVNLPWSKTTVDNLDLAAATRILDSQHFGLGKVKDRLVEFLAVISLKKRFKGPILCLAGPPGVGKTSLGKSVAEALGRKFARIALGGMRDEAEIRGHRRTYVGALPGRIIQALRRTESSNPVILLDELDKVGADFRGDPAAALMEVLDPQQNTSFVDNYLEVPFDLSQVMFITTANWMDPVHPALRDRLEVIELPGYTLQEKIQIARRHLVPRQVEEHGLKKRLVKLPDKTLRRLVSDYTREAGVRNLDREIAGLMRKAARRIAGGGTVPRSIRIDPDDLPEYLGKARFQDEVTESHAPPGVAVGLAWTPVGGSILFVEASRMPGQGKLILTGSLGDVMKESAQAALSYLRSHAAELGIDLSGFEKEDLHVHVPAGATPKDGPSAGTAIATALASMFTRRRVRSGLAMTGEISLRGRVLPVGGIKEKVLAAGRAGVKLVLLPEQNRPDWEEIAKDARGDLKARFVTEVGELLSVALEKK